jgi:hypothetical protein
MKLVLLAILAAAGLIIIFGSPIAKEKPVRDHYYEAPVPILAVIRTPVPRPLPQLSRGKGGARRGGWSTAALH